MLRALFTSKNLIGDSCYIQPALKAWQEDHPDWAIDLLTLNDHITCLYRGMGIRNLNIITEEEQRFDFEGYPFGGPYDFEHTFDVNAAFKLGETENLHIAQAYLKLLGYSVPEHPPGVEYTPPEGPTEKGLVLLSIFSQSCASRQGKPPNKMLSWATWLPILALARQLGKIAVLGSEKDKIMAPPGLIADDEYYMGRSLEEVARLMRDAKLLISIDNGMSHLAATQKTPTILFYPKCLGQHWIVPSGNRRLFVYQMDPMELNVHIGTLILREGIKSLLGEQNEETSTEVQSETESESQEAGESNIQVKAESEGRDRRA